MSAYVMTQSGARIDLRSPDPAQIRLRDIALALSRQCRFAGHSKGFYSVAEHSVLVARVLPQELALHGLLHDAAEAYTGDMISPVKGCVTGLVLMEHALDAAIYQALGLGEPPVGEARAEIRRADLAVGALECQLFGLDVTPGREEQPAQGVSIQCLDWECAYVCWMSEYEVLRGYYYGV